MREQIESRAILLTPPGTAAIAVIRLVGPRVLRFIENHISRPVVPGRCCHRKLIDGENILDDPVLVLSPDGMTLDINLHAGPWVIRSVSELAVRNGFQLAESGSLSEFAVDAGNALERDMLCALPVARTDLAMMRLLSQPAAWAAWRDRILAGDVSDTEIARMVADKSLYHLLNPPRIAIIGIANAGKSTLANALFAQERSITADLPGTTRDWVGEIANIDGLAVMLMDTPGIRATDDPVEAAAIKRADEEIRAADLLILVFDPTQHADSAQEGLRSKYPLALLVVNKFDTRATWTTHPLCNARTVATTGEGIPELRLAILKRFEIRDRPDAAPRWWLETQRQQFVRLRTDRTAMAAWITSCLENT
jgi:tRNA modification GTPase